MPVSSRSKLSRLSSSFKSTTVAPNRPVRRSIERVRDPRVAGEQPADFRRELRVLSVDQPDLAKPARRASSRYPRRRSRVGGKNECRSRESSIGIRFKRGRRTADRSGGLSRGELDAQVSERSRRRRPRIGSGIGAPQTHETAIGPRRRLPELERFPSWSIDRRPAAQGSRISPGRTIQLTARWQRRWAIGQW